MTASLPFFAWSQLSRVTTSIIAFQLLNICKDGRPRSANALKRGVYFREQVSGREAVFPLSRTVHQAASEQQGRASGWPGLCRLQTHLHVECPPRSTRIRNNMLPVV
jgi:hypothetical protein